MTPDLRRSLRIVAEALPAGTVVPVPREQLLELLAEDGAPPAAAPDATAPADRLLTVREAAARLGVSPRYVYLHCRDYPFVKRLPSGALRFSERGLARFLERS